MKYMMAQIDYEGIQRIEKYMFPRAAFREILLNAVVHKDYSSCNPIQISVYKDKIYIWNDGTMPEELASATNLFEKHLSKPYNPLLANVFFKSGMIEAWGTGFEKIKEACNKHGTPLPEYKISSNGVMVLCRPNEKYTKLLNGEYIEESVDKKSAHKSERTLSELLSELLTAKNYEKILPLIPHLEANDSITPKEAELLVEKSPATTRRYLGLLTDVKVLEPTGKANNTTYIKIV